MNGDRIFTKKETYREISDRDLYYDLGLQVRENENKTSGREGSVILYLFFVSLLLQFIFNIPQIITLAMIVLYGGLQQYFADIFKTSLKVISLSLILGANIVDHLIGGIQVFPGEFTSDTLSTVVWILEIIWILFYGVEFLSIFAPVQDTITPNRTVTPATSNLENNFTGLKNRVEGTNYSITDFSEEVDTSLLQHTFRDIVKYLIITFLVIVALDIFIWEIASIISGGNNIEEAYFVSGISLIIYIGIMIYSGTFFGEGNSSPKT